MDTKNQNKEGGKAKGRGFASMNAERQREIASKGGKASALGNTSNRGFASMDAEKQREISRKGGQASHRNRDQQGEQGKK
jgi:general stress protein YciG